ncbi:MAG: ATP-binding protein [Acholeplasmataceae bacterium]
MNSRTSISRNKILSFVFFRLGIIEQFGIGIKRIINSYQNIDERPSFLIDDYQIKIILPVIGYKYYRLNDKDAIISYLKAHPNSSRAEIEIKLKIEKATLLRNLNELISNNLIMKKGNGPNVTYSFL